MSCQAQYGPRAIEMEWAPEAPREWRT